MLDAQTFDSRDVRCKQPYGAVPAGTRVNLALRPLRTGGFSEGLLIAYFESRNEERLEVPMEWKGMDGDRDVFQVVLDTGDYVGLVWYSFRLMGLDGRQEELGPYQLTVYDGAEQVPGWFGEGAAPGFPTPQAWWGAAPSIRTGRRCRSTGPTPGERCATGISSAAISGA